MYRIQTTLPSRVLRVPEPNPKIPFEVNPQPIQNPTKIISTTQPDEIIFGDPSPK